jgi:hypothetical protein
VFDNMNKEQTQKTWGLHDQANQQIRWHYCSVGSTEPDRYVDVRLSDFSWTTGTFDGTSGAVYRPSEGLPVTVDTDGFVHLHGIGSDADGEPMDSYITFGLYALSRGDINVDVYGFVPDLERQSGALSVELYGKDRPGQRSESGRSDDHDHSGRGRRRFAPTGKTFRIYRAQQCSRRRLPAWHACGRLATGRG